jgi:DNA polymerase-3 subunit delta'
MFINQIIGQDSLKEKLISSLDSSQIPHSQCFIDSSGRGGLALAIAVALEILWSEKDLAPHTNKGKEASFFLEHPDLHLVFPVATSVSVSSKPKCSDYVKQFRSFVGKTPYGGSNDWMLSIGSENKQGNISVDEIDLLFKALNLKSFSGGAKVCVLWGVDKLNIQSANKLLKLIEEPPDKTFFIFVAANELDLLPTIKSRCQLSSLKPLRTNIIKDELVHKGCEENLAAFYAANAEGSLGRALESFQNIEQQKEYETLFVQCLRGAFKASGNKSVVIDLMSWANTIGALGRTLQKEFLLYSLHFIRQALLVSYQANSLVHFQSLTGFEIEKFAPFVHSGNAQELIELLEETCYAVDRNANGKILFSDFAMRMTRILNKKEL